MEGNQAHRPIYRICYEIKREWPNMSPYAKPYFDAMHSLTSIKENYYADTGVSVVLYFLANASSWKGEAARRIKAELKQIIKEAK